MAVVFVGLNGLSLLPILGDGQIAAATAFLSYADGRRHSGGGGAIRQTIGEQHVADTCCFMLERAVSSFSRSIDSRVGENCLREDSN